MSRPLRVVIFEDNASARELLLEVIRDAGHDVYAYDDPTACPFSRETKCACEPNEACADAIICDLEMPLQRGLEFVAIQRGKGCRIGHLMMMSGNWTESDRSQADALGCHIIEKPFRLNAVLSWLRRIAGQPRQTVALADWFKLTGAPIRADSRTP